MSVCLNVDLHTCRCNIMSIFAESSDDGIKDRVNSIAQGTAFDTKIAAVMLFYKDK